MIELCNCVNAHHINCLMLQVGDKDKSFSECMGGCPCPCHFLKNGAFVPSGDWLEHRYHVARALQQAREERHTDPRIEAVMPQKVVER